LGHAQPATPGISVESYQVPASCGAQAHFEALLQEALGPEAPTQSAMRVKILVTAKKRRAFALQMQTEAPSGTGLRNLRGRSCEELLETAAVVLSLALESEALYINERTHEVLTTGERHSEAPRQRQGQIGDDETPGLGRRVESKTLKKAKPTESLDTALRLVALSEIGILPRAALGLGLTADAWSGPYQVSFRLTRYAEQVQFVRSEGQSGGSFDLLSGTLGVCRDRERPDASKPIGGLCLQGSVARISATGIGEVAKTAVNTLASVGWGLFRDVPIGPTSLRLRVEGAWQLVRPRYRVTIFRDPLDVDRSETKVHQPSAASLQLGASWGVSF